MASFELEPQSLATLANLGKTFREAQRDAVRERALSELANTDDPEAFTRVGRSLIASGDLQGGISLAALGQKYEDRKADQEALTTLGNLYSATSPQSRQAPSGAPMATDTSTPRGIRNNNPLNIEAGPFTKTLPGFSGSDGRFARFQTPEQGVEAAGKLLDVYATRHGLNTVSGIIGRWAPAGENDTRGYAASVAGRLGVSPDQPLDLSDPKVKTALIEAMGQFENGRPIRMASAAPQVMGFEGVPERPDAKGVYGADAVLLPQEPSQVAQAAPTGAQDGATLPPNATPAQGFTVPGQPAQSGVPADYGQRPQSPRVGALIQMLARAKSEGSREAVKTLLQHELGNTKLTPDILEFEYARAQGFKGDFPQWMARKKGGAGEYGLQPIWGTRKDGSVGIIQLGKGGDAVETRMPEGFQPGKDAIKVDAGTHWVLLDPVTRQPIDRISKNIEAAKAAGERGEAQGKAQVNLPGALAKADLALKTIRQIREHPGKNWSVGITGVLPPIPGMDQRGFIRLVDQLKGQVFLDAFESLKGGGAITEIEGQKAEAARARLDRAQSRNDFDVALNDIAEIINAGRIRAETLARGATQPSSDGWTDIAPGVRIREKR